MARTKRKKLSKPLTAEIIAELGGGKVVAEMLGISEPAVTQQKKKGLSWIYVELFRLKYPHLASVRKTYDEF